MSNATSTAVNTANNGGVTAAINASRLALIRDATQATVANMTPTELQNPLYVETSVLEACNVRIGLENANRPKGHKYKFLDSLMPSQIGDIILRAYCVRNISYTGATTGTRDYDLLGVYCDHGLNEGVYITEQTELRNIIMEYNYGIKGRDIDETIAYLHSHAPRAQRCTDRNLIAVANGIFDYRSKTLLPFSPEYVFTVKPRVKFNPTAQNVTIHNADDGTNWDVESWMNDLFEGDPEVAALIWQILGAIIRPNISWGKSAWFYSEAGNNGKGTLCELMRQLCGEGAYAAIPLSDMGKDFALEPLTYSTAIIVDENDVGTFIDKAANLKALITGDVIMVNRKFRTPIALGFRGFMVQCVNEMPRVKDRSDSFFRRQIFVPFVKSFTGRERKYIKDDYLKRPDVLEYVLRKVLTLIPDYYDLTVPESCKRALEEYREYIDPVRAFLIEIMPQVQWDLLPYQFLYELYCAWYKKSNAGDTHSTLGKAAFVKSIKPIIAEKFPEWDCTDNSRVQRVRTGAKMLRPEPLIVEFDLEDWMNPAYCNKPVANKALKYTPVRTQFNESYKGVFRRTAIAGEDMSA